MKNNLTNHILVLVVLTVALIFTACKKDKDPVDLTKKTTVQLSGNQEVPANTSTGSGTAQISFDPTAKTITYTMSWQLGNPSATTTNMHFHGAEDGSDIKSSPPVIHITGFATGSSGTISEVTRALTDTEVKQLLDGKWYLNIHSSTIGAGELRGNIKFN